jgi:hypothetical protein
VKRRFSYEVRGLKRWPLRTPYRTIAADVADLVKGPPLAGCILGVDKTGVGAGVLEIIQAARPNARIRPILITAGHEVTPDGPGFRVPKLELVAVVTSLLDGGRLAIPNTHPDAKTLAKELREFRVKVTAAGNETAEADWRSRAHDDLVLALAIAGWLGEHGTGEFWLRAGGSFLPGPAVVIEENAAMGKVVTVPAGPRRGIDISPGAAGWQSSR